MNTILEKLSYCSFVIAALPRSRTVWTSLLFTHGDVECLHDKLSFHSPAQWSRASQWQDGTPVCGIIDTGIMGHHFSFKQHAPHVKIGYIINDATLSAKSSIKFLEQLWTSAPEFRQGVAVGLMAKLYSSWQTEFLKDNGENVYKIHISQLDDYPTCAQWFCDLTDRELDRAWHERMRGIRAQVNPDYCNVLRPGLKLPHL